MRIRSKLVSFFLATLSVIALYVGLVFLLRAIGVDTIHTHLKQLGLWAPVVFLLLCTMSMIVAPLSVSTVYLAGGVLFGQPIGFTLSFLGAVLGCSANFWISRKLGRDIVTRLVGNGSLDELDQLIHRFKGHHSIALMTLLLPISQDIGSYAIGLTKMKFWHFFIAVVLSSAAVTGVYVFWGSKLLGTML